MKHDGSTSRLNALLRANPVDVPEAPPAAPDLVELLVHSFLVWEATRAQADAALARIRSATVSFNEFRVCLVKEVVDLVGPRYPLAQERAIRVRAAINDLFRREHSVSLDRAGGMSKRDARVYIESLQGMVPFVSARVALLGLDVHAVPVDEQTLAALVHGGALHAETTIPEATGWLQRHLAAEKALAAHLSLQRAAETFVAKALARGEIRPALRSPPPLPPPPPPPPAPVEPPRPAKSAPPARSGGAAKGAARPAGKSAPAARPARATPASSAAAKRASRRPAKRSASARAAPRRSESRRARAKSKHGARSSGSRGSRSPRSSGRAPKRAKPARRSAGRARRSRR